MPVTLGGKLFTLIYALYGIPIFVWYIVKLGILFKIVVMRSISLFRKFLRFEPALSRSSYLLMQVSKCKVQN